MNIRSLAISIAAGASLVAGQASAQECISQAQISNLAIYAVPLLVDGVQGKCVGQLPSDGFLATSGAEFTAPYTHLQDSVWPEAREGFMYFAANGGKQDEGMQGEGLANAQLLRSLPDEALRPLFDAIITQKVGESVKLGDCHKVERALELMAPLPPENTGELIALLVSAVGKQEPKVCESE